MNVTRWEDWYAEVDRAFTALRERCEQVFVMGLSMGGSLALRLAENRGDEVAGLVLVNPAVHTERTDRHLLPFICGTSSRRSPASRNDIKKPGQDEGAYDKIPLQRRLLAGSTGCGRQSAPTSRKVDRADAAAALARSTTWSSRATPRGSWRTRPRSTPRRSARDSFHVATLDNDAPIIEERSLDFVRRLAPAARP